MPAPAPGLVEAGIDRQPIDPSVEPVWVAQASELSPRPEQGFLYGVARKLRIPEDESGSDVQPYHGSTDKLGEGLMVAPLCSLDEPSLIHGYPLPASRPGGRSLKVNDEVAARTVLARHEAVSWLTSSPAANQAIRSPPA